MAVQDSQGITTFAETAKLLRMSQTQLRRLVANGDIEYLTLGLGKVRRRIAFTPEQRAAFLAARTQGGADQ
jgi:hypothetical protein